jgi:hypothetical protein
MATMVNGSEELKIPSSNLKLCGLVLPHSYVKIMDRSKIHSFIFYIIDFTF